MKTEYQIVGRFKHSAKLMPKTMHSRPMTLTEVKKFLKYWLETFKGRVEVVQIG